MRLRLNKKVLTTFVAVFALLLLMGASDCNGDSSAGDEQRDKAVSGRWRNFDRAVAKYPDPQLSNFPMREALIEMTNRQDMVNHPWYVYIFGHNGNMIGHYVAETVPINACNFLSSSEDVYEDNNEAGLTTLSAPSLDGMFYGNSACDAWFFIDVASNSLVQIRGMAFHASEAPMVLDAEAQKFVVEEVE
jgi:hypothetical protein